MSVIVDLMGLTVLPEEVNLLKHPNTSGVIFFARNIQSRAQLIQLTQEISAINPALFLCIDHEGGYVQRIQRLGFRPLPAAHVYGDIYDINQGVASQMAKQYGEHMAQELRACGIHIGLAPVLDIHGPNPIIGGLHRAFHHTPKGVTQLAGAFISGMHKAGMPSVGKHFPGHGFCEVDSHIGHPTDARTLKTLNNSDLKPFIALTESNQLDAIMPAHITYPKIDATHAAGYSPKWLQEILRDEIGFKGLIMSDCLGMTGADIGDLLTRGTQALTAGCNVLIAANQPREVLKNFLDALPMHFHEASLPYLSDFKNKIKPLQLTPEDKQASTLTTPPRVQDNKSAQNPTETI